MNSKNNTFLRFMAENNIAKSMEQYKDNNIMDWQALFEIQRRNTQSWSKAGKMTMDNLQNMAESQRSALTKIAQDNAILNNKYEEPAAEEQTATKDSTNKKARSI